jgi:outer membrane protein OmpA-like peptidoglycan-associated protein
VPIADLATLAAVVDGGTVTVAGAVSSTRLRDELLDAVRAGVGGAEVDDRLAVDGDAGDHAQQEFAAILRALGGDATAATVSLHLGRVVVVGTVADAAVVPGLRAAALEAADGDPGAVDVRLAVGQGAPATDTQVAEQITALPPITFSSRGSTPDGASLGIIEMAAELLRSRPALSVVVEGHTDAGGSPLGNLALSRERAEVVATRLRQAGIDEGRISTAGYGADRPEVPGRDRLSNAVNRRVVLVGVVG